MRATKLNHTFGFILPDKLSPKGRFKMKKAAPIGTASSGQLV